MPEWVEPVCGTVMLLGFMAFAYLIVRRFDRRK